MQIISIYATLGTSAGEVGVYGMHAVSGYRIGSNDSSADSGEVERPIAVSGEKLGGGSACWRNKNLLRIQRRETVKVV